MQDASGDNDNSAEDQLTEGLRERKKRLTRQLLSDTATAMFLERGFDGFRVAEVAEACDVSEKTVYNYFPTKESLILDREDYVAEAIRHALRPDGGSRSPVEAIVDVLAEVRREMRSSIPVPDEQVGLAMFRRFMARINETPSLRAAAKEMSDRLARVAAEALAGRAGVSPDDPEPTIAAQALVGLWEVQGRALRRELPDETADDVYDRVSRDVDRAARLIDTGLWSFYAVESDGAAADSVQAAARQVANALGQARRIWLEHAQMEATSHGKAPGDDLRSSASQWRDLQRETVRQWREAQRQHQKMWREETRRRRRD